MTLSTENRPYLIMAQDLSRPEKPAERVDTADNEETAAYLMGEYQLAFGTGFQVTYLPDPNR